MKSYYYKGYLIQHFNMSRQGFYQRWKITARNFKSQSFKTLKKAIEHIKNNLPARDKWERIKR